MSRRGWIASLLGATLALSWSLTGGAQAPGDGPAYVNGTDLVRPVDYEAWPYIGGGLGMSYVEGGGTPEGDDPIFSAARVNPSSYRYFQANGTWPDGTVFVLEFRRSATEGSINVAGRYATDVVTVEAEVKDSRFADGWAYFNFGPGDALRTSTPPLGADAAAPCVECHSQNGAVERTFVQFYPGLLDIAREKGTLKPGF